MGIVLRLTLIALLLLPSSPAGAAAPADEPAFCTVFVAAVKPVDAAGARQAFAIEPMVDGSATLSGSIAAFTADDRRYDLPFANVTLSRQSPGVAVFQFPAPVRITGAYIASLDQPTPGACAIVEPWTDERPAPSPTSSPMKAFGSIDSNTPATRVTDPGQPAPLTCPVPNQPAKPVNEEGFSGLWTVGKVYVLVTIGADGVPFQASVDHMDPSVARLPNAVVVGAEAVQTVMHKHFSTGTFRCHHVADRYMYIVDHLPS